MLMTKKEVVKMEFVEGEEPCTDVLPFWTSISSASCAKNSTMKKLLLFKQVDEDILSLLEMTFEEGEKEEKKTIKKEKRTPVSSTQRGHSLHRPGQSRSKSPFTNNVFLVQPLL